MAGIWNRHWKTAEFFSDGDENVITACISSHLWNLCLISLACLSNCFCVDLSGSLSACKCLSVWASFCTMFILSCLLLCLSAMSVFVSHSYLCLCPYIWRSLSLPWYSILIKLAPVCTTLLFPSRDGLRHATQSFVPPLLFACGKILGIPRFRCWVRF